MDGDHERALADQLKGRSLSSTTDIVDSLLDKVFASDIAIRMADERRTEPHEWIRAHNIEIPDAAGADAVDNRHPEMEPFVVYTDELVTISAILVDHRLCFPAFGFRIDSKYGSVAISGDTAYSTNCIKLANNVDLLLHEVIDLPAILSTFPDGPTRDGIEVHLRESHTSYMDVGQVARLSGAKSLVLHHVVPNTPGAADLTTMLSAVRKDYDSEVVIAEDNDVYRIRPSVTAVSDVVAQSVGAVEATV